MFALVVDKALRSKEATKVYTDALESALVEINKLVIGCGTSSQTFGCGTSSQKFGCGTSVGGPGKKGSNMENSFYEQNHARPKGCGKRLKGLKEKALRKVQKYHGRKCNGNRPGYGSALYNANIEYELASQWSTLGVSGSVAVGSHGYSGYSGIDGSYACPRSYGVVGERDANTRNSNSIGEGGEQHGSGVGHMGNDYDANYGYRNTYN
ncbi:hypothetical protein IFM89_012254 [Coptis chinensis]|uniref:Uncharacterized protein n=1 Tax=Coptis chinensis TaxID=261450 RepID=A0A835HE80_9MAGN|nr:hypothetical protein IFM89_012254 [Coptis chinensis]